MMTHALPGRMAGVHLNELGRQQAERLADRLEGAPIAAIFSSPLERARETAEPVARRLGLEIRTLPGIIEIDYGEWTGKAWSELREHPRFNQYNSFRSGTRVPGGELMIEAQTRIVVELEALRAEYPDKLLALFSHGDLIKGALAYYAGIPLDLFRRLEVSPASVSVLRVADEGPRLIRTNDTGNLADAWKDIV